MSSFRFSAAIPLVVLLAASPALADAQRHAQAAKKAERHGEWRHALDEWKAAYGEDANAEYLIGIGDAWAHLGNQSEARKSYEAYLRDPLALPASASRVKVKVAMLDGGGLGVPAAPASDNLLGLPASAAPAARTAAASPKGRADTTASDALGLPDLAAARPARTGFALGLPGDVARAGPEASVAEKKPAATDFGLGLPGEPAKAATPAVATGTVAPTRTSTASPGSPSAGRGAAALASGSIAAGAHGGAVAAGVIASPATADARGQQVASASTTGNARSPAAPPDRPRPAPGAALGEAPASRSSPAVSGGRSNAIAYVTASVALVALGGGAFAYTKASSAHSDLTGSVHDGATSQRLLEDERRNRTMSFVGLAGGLVAAGIATALFAF